ncbi:MAG: hypothetical protein OXT09_28065, partial [Myxococcales bacterium]|nr:hypothetical protein [Myxococcales bacterium]
RSEHPFLCLTREAPGVPFTLDVDLLGLEFFEIGFLEQPEGESWRLAAKAGKIMVPFGAEPRWHNSYGGKAGFDNDLLPPVFAELGAAVQGQYAVAGTGLRLRLDLYSVRGYRLARADQELNLQADAAPASDPSIAVGGRLGLSLGPFSGRYSGYYNRIGFGRRLYLQALDLELWRLRDVPLLEYFTFAVGAMRADVSGAGAGQDYYHFGSYYTVRVHPRPWLFLQYRQGLQSFGNRRGDYLDETRLTADDGSTHNVGIVARYRGFSAGLYYFWLLEEADEVDDDFTRLSVAYDF